MPRKYQIGDLVYLKAFNYDFWGIPHEPRIIVDFYYKEKDIIVYIVLDDTTSNGYDYIEIGDIDKRRKWKLEKNK